MLMNTSPQKPSPPAISLSTSLSFLMGQKSLLGWSVILVLITIGLTWLGFLLTTGLIDNLTGSFFETAPTHETWWGWIKYGGWLTARYLFVLVSRLISFFLAFLIAYSLTTPFYGFLSTSAEKIYWDKDFEDDNGFSVTGIVKDLLEGFKIAAFGILITIIALFVGFIPIIGQIAVFLIYTYYCALMFIDYPASRRRWGLGRKLFWLRHHGEQALQLGLVPAVITMIPVLNMFLLAAIFPLYTVHAALNFSAVELYHRNDR